MFNKKKLKIIKWDTTVQKELFPKILKKKYYSNYLNQRKAYCNWLGRISQKHSQDIDWWVSSPISRNIYSSNLYKYICILETLEYLIKNKNNLIEISTDSAELRNIILSKFPRNKIRVILIKLEKNNYKLFSYYHNFKTSIFFLFQFILIKLFSKKLTKFNKEISIIDTFILEEKLKDKLYYGNLSKYFNKTKKTTFFVPTIIESSIYKFLKIFLSLNRDEKYFFKENFTNLIDVFYCIFYLFRKKKFLKNYDNYKKFNLSLLIQCEILYNRDILTVFLSLHNYCFARKLKQKSIKIRKVVNWFENQSLDKGWNYGFRKFFPKSKTIGYQGFTPQPEYMNTLATDYEKKYKVIPEKIISIGRNFVNFKKEFCKDLDIIQGPALRFNDLFNSSFHIKKLYTIVLFLEGASKKNDQNLILQFIKVSEKFNNIKFYIKTHPSLSLEKLKIKLPKNIIEIKKKFSFVANRTYIAISCGNTSATIESLAYGCKLIVPIDNSFERRNLKKLKIPNDLYKVCNKPKDIYRSINYFLIKKNEKPKYNGLFIRKKLFNKTTSNNIKILI